MQALNQLVARSIIDPGVVEAFSTGRIGEIVAELDFSTELCDRLSHIEADSWAEYAVLAYRYVKAAEEIAVRIQLPSPLEGLLPGQDRAEDEQVA
jgi:hypothetical protein